MPKCFITGIEIDLQDSWLLDRSAATRALSRLRERLDAIERLVSQLSAQDQVQVHDYRSGVDKARRQRRLICPTVATALSVSNPEFPLFISWKDFRAVRPPVFPKLQAAAIPVPESPGTGKSGEKSPAAPVSLVAEPTEQNVYRYRPMAKEVWGCRAY